MNVLITSSGRRVSLLKAFQQAEFPREVRLFAGDMDPLAPALYEADEPLRLPALNDPTYIDTVLDLADSRGIDLIVPTIDTELALLAESARRFDRIGTRALISSPRVISLCRDKWLTFGFFSENGIRTPRTWLPECLESRDLPDGLYVKPRDGSASQNVHRADTKSLCTVLEMTPNPMVQENVAAPEITIDALLDFEGRPIHYVPRLRLKAIGGESVQGVTVPDDGIRDDVMRVLEALGAAGAIGPMTLQAFLADGGPVFTEVNPRFGGGFPLTHYAGGRYPDWILRMAAGERLAPRIGEYRTGVYMTRHSVETFTEEPLWQS